MRTARSSSNPGSRQLPLRIGCSSDGTASRHDRRPMYLAGYARLQDGETFAVNLVDLSYDGCKVETPVALLPGTPVTLCVAGLRELHGDLRWCSGVYAGICFGQVEQETRRECRRRAKRIKLDGQVFISHATGGRYPTRVFDFSATGCSIEFLKEIAAGERLKIRFPGWCALEAELRWLHEFRGGVEFSKAIDAPIFEVMRGYVRRFCIDQNEIGHLAT